MYSWNALRNLLHFWTFDDPVRILLPAAFLGAALLQGFLLWSKKSSFKWLILILSAVMVLACEVSIWLIRSYFVLLIVVVVHFAMAILLGAVIGTFIYKFWTKVRHS